MRKRDMVRVFASVCVGQACSNKISPISNPDLNFPKNTRLRIDAVVEHQQHDERHNRHRRQHERTPLSTQISRQILFQVPLRLEKEIKFWAHFLTLGFFFLLFGSFPVSLFLCQILFKQFRRKMFKCDR